MMTCLFVPPVAAEEPAIALGEFVLHDARWDPAGEVRA